MKAHNVVRSCTLELIFHIGTIDAVTNELALNAGLNEL